MTTDASPLRSMTGFGRATAQVGAVAATVEVRAVNGRFAEVTLRAPRLLGPHEAALTAAVKDVLVRGNATVHVALDTPEAAAGLAVDAGSARAYADLLRQLREAAGLDASEAPISIADLLRQPDLLVADEAGGNADAAWEAVQPALTEALRAFDAMRLAEGAALHADLAARADALEHLLAQVEARAPERLAEARRKTDERLAALLSTDGADLRRLDPARLDAEVALLADKLDVTEECVRLRSHLAQVRDALDADEPIGRRLGFLTQEVNREINTIGSKANDAAVAQLSVAMKEELEKIREQINNVL